MLLGGILEEQLSAIAAAALQLLPVEDVEEFR